MKSPTTKTQPKSLLTTSIAVIVFNANSLIEVDHKKKKKKTKKNKNKTKQNSAYGQTQVRDPTRVGTTSEPLNMSKKKLYIIFLKCFCFEPLK